MDSNSSVLPPELERQLQVGSSVIVGATAVFIWDILHSLSEDYHILFKLNFQASAAVYLVSRIASLVYTLGFTLFSTYPLPNCQAALVAFNAFYPLSSASTSLLFFFRVRAIYARRPLITYIFGFLWLCMLAGALTVPMGSSATTVGHTCIITQLAPYMGANGVGMTVFDTSVFLAISYGLLSNGRAEQTPAERVRTAFAFGRANLYAFSESLLRDGQKYYLITVFTNTLTIAMIYAPGVAPIYRGMGSIPNVAVTNIMASRVFRNVKMRYVRDGPINRIILDPHDMRLSLPMISIGSDPPPVHGDGDQEVPTEIQTSRGLSRPRVQVT
ncbi:hypothetical protein MSAN_00619200 [Mycena sanguinolenta]|uniref:Uncharacterized protein n=1 Tax=Mycena sanguinolenta TaxID=230812 RepID=A0A8H7DEC7_9AGAR|nr:hypothetical protein MSAN_00619200 [Mycena sanguinolenta]